MPIYEFKCGDCGAVTEVLLRGGDADPPRCQECGSPQVRKLISTFNSMSRGPVSGGSTCCGRDERCEAPPCSGDSGCRRE
jgi:putative FmdB family regulatory protein